MLHIRNLTLRHRFDDRILIQDLECHLQAGDCVALIGEEGNGKSTLLQLAAAMAGAAPMPEYIDYTGTITLDSDLVGYLPQFLPEKDAEQSIYDYMLSAPGIDLYDTSGWHSAAIEVGLDPGLLYSGQKMGELSGGEKIKVQFVRLLQRRPDIWLLDEPSNDLDLNTLKWLETFMQSRQELIWFISHDETLIRRTADGIVHLEQIWRKTEARWTVARVPYETYITERAHAFSKQDQLARKEEAEHRSKQERYQQIRNRVEHEQNTISRQDPGGGRLLKKKMHAVQALGRRMEKDYENRTRISDSEDAILAFFEETVTLPSSKEILRFRLEALHTPDHTRTLARNLRLDITGPEKVAIIGTNGSGKTTLLRALARDLLTRQDIKAAYMPQDYADLMDAAALPVDWLVPSGQAEARQRALDHLGSMRFTRLEMTRPLRELSGGQKAKLFILRMILNGNNVLILDEPTRNFSPLSGPVIREILAVFGGAVIAVSHDRLFLTEVPDTIYALTEAGLQRFDEDPAGL